MIKAAAKKSKIKNNWSGETLSSLQTSTVDESIILVCAFKTLSYCFQETVGFDFKTSYMRPEMKSSRSEISTHHKRNSIYISFHCQAFLFQWNKGMCWCLLSYNFISSSVYMIFYQLKSNFISVKMTVMK